VLSAPKETFVNVDKGRRAVWNELLTFSVPAGMARPMVELMVLDKETMLSDKPIGMCRVDVSAACASPRAKWYELASPPTASTKARASSGELRLGFAFIPCVIDCFCSITFAPATSLVVCAVSAIAKTCCESDSVPPALVPRCPADLK
jgi:hypothetical protein